MNYLLQLLRFSNLKTFTAKISVTVLLCFVAEQVFAQFQDDFLDGDFTANPAWNGDQSDFFITENMLKLQAPGVAESSYLSTSSYFELENTSWEFWLKVDFNPSASNYTRIYIVSDQPNLEGELNGYFIMVGNTADEISLYKQTGTTKTKIIDGADGLLNQSTNTVRIKVTRDTSGQWEVLTDVGSTGNFALQGTTQDLTYTSSAYFGILCTYTQTRSDKFFFDDFVVTNISAPDNEAPKLMDLEVKSSTALTLEFSEPLDKATAETITNFSADQGIGQPTQASLSEDERTITLFFDSNFPNAINCTLNVKDIKDKNGNTISAIQEHFYFFLPTPSKFKDVIITEIFADPSPKVNLPEAEFIEIYNRGENPVDLANWTITDGSSIAKLKTFVLLPTQYLILCATPEQGLYAPYGNAIGITNFPSLNNAGDQIVFKNELGLIIDSVSYSSKWYNNVDKEDGGYSLELIDTENICAEAENWLASDADEGGTPGEPNSIIANKPDLTPPLLLQAFFKTSDTIQLVFSEKLNTRIPAVNNFSITPSISLLGIKFTDRSLRYLSLACEPARQGVLYNLSVNNIYDCSGNIISSLASIPLAIPQAADSLDVAINEVLFNPRSTGVDFIEIVNRSDKFLNLKSWSTANISGDVYENIQPVSTEDYLVQPGQYVVLTENKNVLKGEYVQGVETTFLECGLPSLPDDEGSVVLLDDNGNRIDQFQYNKDMHSVFIKNEEGVSLERLHLSELTNTRTNWKSASSTVGFASPGYANSNALPQFYNYDESFTIVPEVFNPGSGQSDFTMIHYNLNQGGFVASIKIIDAQGRAIKEIANNEILGTSGFFRWDGDTNTGGKARTGYYMVSIEMFDNDGNVKSIRRKVAVAGTF